MLDALVFGLFVFIAVCLVLDVAIAMSNRNKIIQQNGVLIEKGKKVPRTVRKPLPPINKPIEAQLNVDDLVERIVSGVLEKLKASSVQPAYNIQVERDTVDPNALNVEISMDESIVDVGSSTKGIESSTKKLGKEEIKKDTSLSKSKARIADILKKKGK